MEDGNAFLPAFLARHNGRFARVPARSDDLHRPLDLPPERLRDILCWRDQRYVGQQLTLTYECKHVMLEATEAHAFSCTPICLQVRRDIEVDDQTMR